MELKAVIFDMDGVLTPTVDLHFESWKKTLGEYGITVTREENEKLRGLTRRRSLEILLKGKPIPEDALHEMLRRKNACYLELIDNLGPRHLAPGVSILLQELHLAKIRMGVASASQNVKPVLEKLGIDGFIHALTDGLSVRRPKPDPEIFIETARRLGVDRQDCLAIEDSQTGVRAARAAGMAVIGIGPAERVGEAFTICEDLSKIRMNDLIAIYRRWREAVHPATTLSEEREFA